MYRFKALGMERKMKFSKKKRTNLYILTILIVSIITITACGKKDEENKNLKTSEVEDIDEKDTETIDDSQVTANDDKTIKADNGNPFLNEIIIKIDNEKVSYSEVILYQKYIQSYYENIFGEDIWDYNLGETTIGELAKEDVIDTIIERKIIKKQWENYGIVITEEDEIKIKDDSADYLKNITQEDTEYYGFTFEEVYQFFFDNLMAERVYDAATMDVDTDVPDEVAKQITIQYLLVSTRKTDENGNMIELAEEKKNLAYIKAQELLTEAATVEDFASFSKSNTDSVEVEVTIGKNDLEKVVEEAAFALKTGEISNIIEASDGYYIIYCVDDYNEDATLEKKEEVIDERQSEKFIELFEQWQKDIEIELNEETWDQIKFD